MREVQDIKRLLYPLVKGLPLVLLVFTTAVVVVWRMTNYQTPIFEAKATIKLDDHATGFSDNNLYKDLDIFSETNDVLTEVETIKSDIILLAALDLMPTNIEYYRVGELRTSELYNKSPFYIEYDTNRFASYNELFHLNILNEKWFSISQEADTLVGEFGKEFLFKNNRLTIYQTPFWSSEHGEENLADAYQFRVNTNQFLLSNFVKGNLFIKEIDKNVAVIQIYFEGENPHRVADFVNAVAKAYLQDHISNKMKAAKMTEEFLDSRTQEALDQLHEAENNLESYRLQNLVLNIEQETETDLRKIAQLDIQQVNLNMKKVTLDSLEHYVLTDVDRFLELAPSFEAYGGLLYTELMKKLKSLESEKIDLLNRFTTASEEIQIIDKKINDLVSYLVENIKNHRINTVHQLNLIEAEIERETRKLDNLPSREKKMVMLERQFKHYEDLFNFLKKKQMEAGIAKLAQLNFHRIINQAIAPKEPASPNRGFNVGLAGFLSLLFSIAFVYIAQAIRGKINSRYQLENMSDAPVLGAVKKDVHLNADGSLDAVILSLIPHINNKKGVKIAFNSSIAGEGKTYLAHQVAVTLASVGRKVLLLDFNSRNSSWKTLLGEDNNAVSLENYFSGKTAVSETTNSSRYENLEVGGFENSLQPNRFYLSDKFSDKLTELTNVYDVVIIDNSAYAIASDADVYMGYSDYNIYVVRHNFTDTKYVKNINAIVQKYGVERVGLVLNDVPKGVNYSGDFYGSRYLYNKPKGFFAKVKHYWESYKNAWNI